MASALCCTGALDWIRGRAMQNKAVILLYHRVTDCDDLLDYAPNGISVTPETFEAHVRYLSTRYTLINLSELICRLESSMALPENACVITFDDGWRDNYDTAFPILKRYGVPATIFLATSFIDGGIWYWEERSKFLLAYLYDSYAKGEEDLRAALARSFVGIGVKELPRLAPAAVPAFLTEAINLVRGGGIGDGPAFVKELEAVLDTHQLREPRQFLSWDEVREMSENGVEFGAHTQSHASLTQCTETEAEKEIDGSRNAIHARLNDARDVFAYPYGKTSHDVRRRVVASGFQCACTTELGRVDRYSDLYNLPRIDIRQAVSPTPAFLECRMLGLFGIY